MCWHRSCISTYMIQVMFMIKTISSIGGELKPLGSCIIFEKKKPFIGSKNNIQYLCNIFINMSDIYLRLFSFSIIAVTCLDTSMTKVTVKYVSLIGSYMFPYLLFCQGIYSSSKK